MLVYLACVHLVGLFQCLFHVIIRTMSSFLANIASNGLETCLDLAARAAGVAVVNGVEVAFNWITSDCPVQDNVEAELTANPIAELVAAATQHKSALRMSDELRFWRSETSIGRSSVVLVRPLDVPRHIRVPPHKKSF